MDADLIAIKTALAEISDGELHALIAAPYGVPQTAPGLLAWLAAPTGFAGPRIPAKVAPKWHRL